MLALYTIWVGCCWSHSSTAWLMKLSWKSHWHLSLITCATSVWMRESTEDSVEGCVDGKMKINHFHYTSIQKVSFHKMILYLHPILYKGEIHHLLAGTKEIQGLQYLQNNTALHQEHLHAYLCLIVKSYKYNMYVAMNGILVIITMTWKVIDYCKCKKILRKCLMKSCPTISENNKNWQYKQNIKIKHPESDRKEVTIYNHIKINSTTYCYNLTMI